MNAVFMYIAGYYSEPNTFPILGGFFVNNVVCQSNHFSRLTTKQNVMKQDSKELSPRSLNKMLLKRQINSQNVQSTQLS